MPSDDSSEARVRKPTQSFEGAQLPIVNKVKQKGSAESSKSVALETKNALVNPIQKKRTAKPKAPRRGQSGTILYLVK